MMWFYKLKRSVRVIIAVVAWLPVIIFSGIIGGDVGDDLQAWQAVVFLLLLAVGIVFTVFAVLARKREKQAERDAQPAAAPERVNDTATPRADVRRPSVITMSDAAIHAPVPRKPAPLKTYTTRVKISAFDKRVAGADIHTGDAGIIKYEGDPVMRSSGGYPIIDANCYVGNVKIGLFQYGKYLRALYGTVDYPFTLASVENIDGKYEVYIDIDLPFKKDSKLPMSTKLNGVTFNNRQDALAASDVGDTVQIRHNPTDEYPNTVEVFNVALNASVGVIPSENGEKLLKKYKAGCKFDGVITSIYGGGAGRNYGVDIMILSQTE
ncbi:MAG: hypothetical protein NC548_39760 [Lachnospiraceae bacterium]|nr:hypothetical protein [Lachnospiraceae bacterium]